MTENGRMAMSSDTNGAADATKPSRRARCPAWVLSICGAAILASASLSCVGIQLPEQLSAGRLDFLSGGESRAARLNEEGLRLHEDGLYDEAIEAFTRAIEAEPGNRDYFCNRAHSHLESGAYREAADDFSGALDRASDAPDLDRVHYHFHRGRSWQKLGRLKEAIRDYDSARQYSEKGSIDEARCFSRRGDCYHSLKEYGKALEDYELAMQMQPGDPSFARSAARMLYELQRYQEAVQVDSRCLDLEPMAEAYAGRARSFSKLGRFEDAIEDAGRAIALEPTARYYNKRANLYYENQSYEEAIQDYQRALELSPRDEIILWNCLRAHKKAGDRVGVVRLAGRLLEIQPDDYEALLERGLQHYRLGRNEDALADLDRTIEIETRGGEYNLRGLTHESMGNRQLAVADYDRAIALQADNHVFHANRGWAHFRMHRYGEAQRDFDRSLAIRGDYVQAHDGRGRALAAQGRHEEAIREYTEELGGREDRGYAYFKRAWSHLHCGRPREALEDVKSIYVSEGFSDSVGVCGGVVGYFACRMMHLEDEGFRFLAEKSGQYDRDLWPQPVARYLLGVTTARELLAEVSGDPGRTVEVHGYVGFELALNGRVEAAQERFDRVLEDADHPSTFVYWIAEGGAQALRVPEFEIRAVGVRPGRPAPGDTTSWEVAYEPCDEEVVVDEYWMLSFGGRELFSEERHQRFTVAPGQATHAIPFRIPGTAQPGVYAVTLRAAARGVTRIAETTFEVR